MDGSTSPAANVVMIETFHNEASTEFKVPAQRAARLSEMNAYVKAIVEVFLRR